ncbi:ABC transporter-like protein [Desulfosarcina cetonica]|nr:ABC transporter-like protein [Desulfosarcina cetonica]
MSKLKSSIDMESVSLRFRSYGTSQNGKGPKLLRRILRNQYSRSEERWIFRDLTVHITNGERIGIVGRNGAGKSTLLKLIAGVYPPTHGRIRVVGRTSPLIGLGAGMQPELSGVENVILMGTMMAIPVDEMTRRLNPIIEFAGLAAYANMPVKYYSSGMRQRLAFATATEIAPDILLSDEVFAGGDGEFKQRAEKRISDAIDQSNIFIFVSHSTNLLHTITQRTLWIEAGRIVGDGPTKTICGQYTDFLKQIKNGSVPRK